jgi:NAD(P)-dependent dehydrogenase (short-subunit alcohol dehydrogenase family)
MNEHRYTRPTRLKDRVAIVTGAGSIGPGWGNGKATALTFAREGARIIAMDASADAVAETTALIRDEGGECTAFVGDVSKSHDVARLIECALETYGAIDILHNNVGINRPDRIAELSEEDWDRVLDVNVKSMFLTCRAALPVMAEKGKGVVINVSSIAGIRYFRIPYIAYSTSKGAVLAFTRTIAMEYASRGIRANSILPGLLHTPMVMAALGTTYAKSESEIIRERNAQIPLGRMGTAWDVANAAAFLASDEANFITGAELVVDGGMSCSTG